MYFLRDHLEIGSFRNAYTDTDSCALATTRTLPIKPDMTIEQKYRAVFDPIVKPEMKESWEKTWKSWFVTTNVVEDVRYPGKLKGLINWLLVKLFFSEEFAFEKGVFCALAPKTYMAFNSDPNAKEKTKCGTKGIPHSENICLQAFLDKLYNHGSHSVTLRSLRLNNDKVMSRITMIKSGLSDLVVKFPVDDDMITCSPLVKDGQYL